MSQLRPAVVVVLVLAVEACGGGGGGGATANPGVSAGPPAPTPTSANTSASATALVPPGSFLAGPAVNDAAGTLPHGAQVTSSNDPATGNARLLAVNVISPSSGATVYAHTFDLANATARTRFPANFIGLFEGQTLSDGQHEHEIALDPSLTYASYGVWSHENAPGSGQSGALVFGQTTPSANVPVSGTASYSGSTIGGLVIGSTTYLLSGTAQLTANFAANTVTGSLSGMKALAVDNTVTPWNTLAINSTISSSNRTVYAGTVTSTSTSTLSPDPLSGTVIGNFYGPHANETAGVWAVTDGTTKAFGSFGAK